MKNYRLKPEARPFISEKHATRVYDFPTWDKLSVNMNALEEVKPAYITYGIETSKNSSSLSGWSEKNGADYKFTIHFPSQKFMEHDKFSKGNVIGELMDLMQSVIDSFYERYSNLED